MTARRPDLPLDAIHIKQSYRHGFLFEVLNDPFELCSDSTEWKSSLTRPHDSMRSGK
ncbi:hypothetical protein SAMN04487948_13314 [Halogranum amylolyticum]|uniref:Uncharacterized protein n=1 Tax=Halogranum amylolyticum TaxID=660520 RepID=A0A1H8WL47_9EURY|nr:hypothetical protein SAMN04487948_13314 [Halogranum amylolyticum]